MKKKYTTSGNLLSLLISILLIFAILIAYGQVRNFDFVGYDDELYITENLNVQKGLTAKGLNWAFTTFHSANWHPLTWLSHMLDCELYGLNPMGHHWTNLQLHITNTILLFLILQLMTGAIWRSAFVAALFALHPLHVESVAWVSERKDVLSTFFGLLMIGAYYRYVKMSNLKNYLLVIIFLSLGLMAKPMLVTFPFVLLLLDFWPLERFQFKNDLSLHSDGSVFTGFQGFFRLILEKIPLVIPVVISCILTFLAQQSQGAVKTLGALPLKNRVANAFVSYVSYTVKAVWPSNLAVFYPHPGNTIPAWQIIAAVLIIAVATFLSIRSLKKYPYLAVGLFWYLGTLIPVIGLVQVGEQAMADRYTYIPLIGLFIIVAWGVLDLFRKRHYRKIYLSMFALIILSALTARTFFQASHWKNGVTLFERAIKVTENNYKAHNNLATVLGPIDLDRAIYYYKESLKSKPNYARALYNLGTALYERGNYDEAVFYFTKAVKINPKKTDARMNLANVLFIQGKSNEAVSHYNEIIKTDSENADVHSNLAYVLSTQGKLDEAVFHCKEAIRIKPKHDKAHYNFGNILLKQGNIKEAATHFLEAIRIRPDYVQAYNKIGLMLVRQGKDKKAEVFFLKAIQIDPNYSEARNNLEMLMRTIKSNRP
jgi:tetratricopeptide (TPR) repeat protein